MMPRNRMPCSSQAPTNEESAGSTPRARSWMGLPRTADKNLCPQISAKQPRFQGVLVMTSLLWKIIMFNGEIHHKGSFSVAMLVITRGYTDSNYGVIIDCSKPWSLVPLGQMTLLFFGWCNQFKHFAVFNICICIDTYIYIYIYMHTQVCIHMYTYVYICIHMYTYAYMLLYVFSEIKLYFQYLVFKGPEF